MLIHYRKAEIRARQGRALREKGEVLKTAEHNGQSPLANQATGWASGKRTGAGSQVTCSNCGAVFSIEEACCPYCGALYIYGAEKAYMGELDSLKNATDDLDDNAEESFKDSLKQNTKRTVIVIGIVVAVLAALFLVVNCMGKNAEREEVQNFQAREAFREKHFDEFDRLYEAKDDDALSAYVWSLAEEPGFDALFSWKHVGFLEVHDGWEGLRLFEERIESGKCKLDDYTWSVSLALRIAQLDGSDGTEYSRLSKDEEERAADYRAYARKFLRDVLQMNDEEVAAFADEAKDAQGFIQEKELRRNLENRLRQLGIPY